jgi:hypothetical protein
VTKLEASGISRNDALVNDLCVNNHLYFYAWFLVNVLITVLRSQSLLLMLRGYKTLSKKAADNAKKIKDKLEKVKKTRRSKKKELNKILAEKRNELFKVS